MARLHTTGFEVGVFGTTALVSGEGEASFAQAGPVYNTTTKRTGARSFEMPAATVNAYYNVTKTGVLGRTYYVRFYLRFAAAPTSGSNVLRVLNTTPADIMRLTFGASATLQLANSAGTAVGTASGTLANDTWHRIEVSFNAPAAGNGTLALRINGAVIEAGVSTSTLNVALGEIRLGTGGTAGGTSRFHDDLAINDDQGADQNSWPGEGSVYLLVPTALGAGGRGNWTEGGGGTTNLHTDVDNTPPTGTAAGANGTQIENANATVPSSAEFDLTTYTAAGIPAGDDIKLVQALWRVATDSLTATNPGTGRLFSNPDLGADTALDFEGSTAVAGVDPAGWQTQRSAVAYNPTVVRGTAPGLRITKTTAATRTHSADLMGVYVESAPGAPSGRGPGAKTNFQAVQRAAVR